MKKRGRRPSAAAAEVAWSEALDWELNFSQMPYYFLDGIDGQAARRLLSRLPESTLDNRWNHSPTLGTFLRSIAKHPQVKGNARLSDSGELDEHAALSGVIIDDPELVAFTPDTALGPVPAWIEDLDEELQREYRISRELCIRSSVYRQRWLAAQLRYDIHDAITGPDELDVVGGPDGRSVLHLWWD